MFLNLFFPVAIMEIYIALMLKLTRLSGTRMFGLILVDSLPLNQRVDSVAFPVVVNFLYEPSPDGFKHIATAEVLKQAENASSDQTPAPKMARGSQNW